MPDAIGRNQKLAGPRRKLAPIEQKYALPLDYVVHLVHSGVRVQLVGLSRLEGIKSYEQMTGFENRALSHLVRTPRRVVRRGDY